MNVLQNLVGLYNHLSLDSTYRNVCKAILNNLEFSAGATIYEIAELADSSRTTVWRMVQKMGYQDFTSFHHDLKKAVSQYTYYNRILPADMITDEEGIKNAFTDQASQVPAIIQEYVNAEELARMTRILFDADKVNIYASFQSAAVFSLQQNLAMTGKETNYVSMVPDMLENSKTLTSESIVFMNIIEYAETMNIAEVFTEVKKRGAKIYVVIEAKHRHRKYVDKVLIPYSGEAGIAAEMMMFEMYFYILSESYRYKYLNE
ncbi:MAG: MurR/RpiR family transcriptional regulator [Suipraeoptans sp.]